MLSQALENVTGVHYWAVDTWGGDNSVLGVEQINGTMLTTFNVWNSAELVKGDGLLMSPPQSPTQGPLSSIRLENIRDGEAPNPTSPHAYLTLTSLHLT